MDFTQLYSKYAAMAESALNDLVLQMSADTDVFALNDAIASSGVTAHSDAAALPDDGADVLAQSMSYGVTGGGKRVRPVLALASCDIVGGNIGRAVIPAAAIELIHAYSLIHDDLPCMDDDDMRRDRPTAHKVFGEALALLAGDALLTMAFEVLSRPSDLPPAIQLRLVREVAEAAGCHGMVLGQALDMQWTMDNGQESGSADQCRAGRLEMLKRIHMLKTGRLLRVSARLGALCGGCTQEQLDLLTLYAEKVGLAFQIQDDVLDEIGHSDCMGKNAGSDARLGKLTYVSLLGLEEAVRQRDQALAEAGQVLEPFGEKAGFLCGLADFIASRKR